MARMKWVIGFIAGLLAGVLLMMVIRPDHTAELAAMRQEAAQTAKQLDLLKAQLTKAQAGSTPVGLSTGDGRRAAGGKAAAAKGVKGPAGMFGEKFAKAIGEMAQSQVKAQIEAKLGQIVERLGLTPEQEKKLRALVEPQIEGLVGQMQGAMEGKTIKSGDLAHATAIQLGMLPADVEATLTPEQKTAYESFKQEEKTNRIETRASAELMGLQGIGLTQGQKDQAFEAFCRLAQEDEETMSNMSKAGSAGSGVDPKEQMDRMFSRRVEALRAVLTEPQMKGYEAQVEMQRRIISEMGVGVEVAPGSGK